MGKIEEVECESKNLLNSNIDWDNPDQVADIVNKIMATEDNNKIKLYILGEILTKNKNEVITDIKTLVTELNKKIYNQRRHIATLDKKIEKYRERIGNQQKVISMLNRDCKRNSSPKPKYLSADDIALQKAKAAYDSQFNPGYVQPKKKFIVHKKSRNPENQ